MNDAWRQRALKVWARSALALGETDLAFLELEQIIARAEEPELAMFVVDAMIADRQWQRAMVVAERFANRTDAVGDQARHRKVRALFQQAIASKRLVEFPQAATAIAPRIHDVELRRDVSRMLGDAYRHLGMLEHASDALRGILR